MGERNKLKSIDGKTYVQYQNEKGELVVQELNNKQAQALDDISLLASELAKEACDKGMSFNMLRLAVKAGESTIDTFIPEQADQSDEIFNEQRGM